MFTLYIAPFQAIISAHNQDCTFYAHDSQLYVTVGPFDERPTLNTVQKCICEVIKWNTKYKCNPSKTKVIQFSSGSSRTQFFSVFSIGNALVQPSGWVYTPGVNLDRELNAIQALLAVRFIGKSRKFG